MKKLFIMLLMATFVSPVMAQNVTPETTAKFAALSHGFQHIGIPVKDMKATIKFYEGLGFKVAHVTKPLNGREFVFMNQGSMMLEFIPSDSTPGVAGAVDHICLDATNIEELYDAAVKAGYRIANKLVTIPFWEKGCKCFKIYGPDNEIIEWCEIIK